MARSLCDIDSSIETGAVLHLSGAALNPAIEHTVVPPPRLEHHEPDERDYKYLQERILHTHACLLIISHVWFVQDPKELRCWHVYSPSSYNLEPSFCNCEPKHPWERNQQTAVVAPAPTAQLAYDTPPAAEPIEAKLKKLNELKETGLVTEEEYNKKRADILGTL